MFSAEEGGVEREREEGEEEGEGEREGKRERASERARERPGHVGPCGPLRGPRHRRTAQQRILQSQAGAGPSVPHQRRGKCVQPAPEAAQVEAPV